MGLDITAYRKIVRVSDYPESGDYDWKTLAAPYPNDDFPKQADGITCGLYSYAEEMGFRAGSYSGYNRWREALAMAAHGDMPQVIWAAEQRGTDIYTGKPFVELIHFADNEGVIGPKTSAKLAADFKAHREAVFAKMTDEYDRERYDLWQAAFEMAADDGCVSFH